MLVLINVQAQYERKNTFIDDEGQYTLLEMTIERIAIPVAKFILSDQTK